MKRLFESYGAYISERLGSRPLTEPQQRVLAYLIKSEWANEQMGYTIALTPDNNHFNELVTLEKAGLIRLHARSREYYPIYVVDRILLTRSYREQLRELFGSAIDGLKPLSQDVLNIIYRYTHFSGQSAVSAKQASFALWYERERSHDDDIREFDRFYRGIRYVFNVLSKGGFIVKQEGSSGYRLNEKRSREYLAI